LISTRGRKKGVSPQRSERGSFQEGPKGEKGMERRQRLAGGGGFTAVIAIGKSLLYGDPESLKETTNDLILRLSGGQGSEGRTPDDTSSRSLGGTAS